MKSKTLDLIAKLVKHEQTLHGQTFFAPLTMDGKARLRVQGLVYELQVKNAQPGWWLCRIMDACTAKLIGDAELWQRGEYLQLWPALRLVLLEQLEHGAWLALPYNPSDALQRFGIAGPVIVQLVEGGQLFERVIGRVDGSTIWYDDHDRRSDPWIAENLRTSFAAEQESHGVAGVGAGENAAYLLLLSRHNMQRGKTATVAIEQRLRDALHMGGARLLGYETTDYDIRVTWERSGQRNVTLVDPQLGVVSAGICLSGEDQRFDLTSIVDVVGDAPAYARWDNE
jgi:hypothetical protein